MEYAHNIAYGLTQTLVKAEQTNRVHTHAVTKKAMFFMEMRDCYMRGNVYPITGCLAQRTVEGNCLISPSPSGAQMYYYNGFYKQQQREPAKFKFTRQTDNHMSL